MMFTLLLLSLLPVIYGVPLQENILHFKNPEVTLDELKMIQQTADYDKLLNMELQQGDLQSQERITMYQPYQTLYMDYVFGDSCLDDSRISTYGEPKHEFSKMICKDSCTYNPQLAHWIYTSIPHIYNMRCNGGQFEPPEAVENHWGKHIATISGNTLNNEQGMDIFIGVFEIDNYIVFNSRGVRNKEEWVSCFNALLTKANGFPGLIHKGFHSIYTGGSNSMQKQVFSTLNNINLEGKTIMVSGHSLGGALSTLIAWDIENKLKPQHLIHMTYGSPRVGNNEFASKFNDAVPNSFRLANTRDIITTVPPSFVGRYTHVGAVNAVEFSLKSSSWLPHKAISFTHISSYNVWLNKIIEPVSPMK